jgi:hypothetical protein
MGYGIRLPGNGTVPQMENVLLWKPSKWGVGLDAMGASGLYYMIISSKGVDDASAYFATARVNMAVEPRYLGCFPCDSAGLDAAQAACQAFEAVADTATPA